MRQVLSVFVAVMLMLTAVALRQQTSKQDDAHHHEMEQRGDQGMGFAQDETTHHFLLRKDGGVIQVTAKSADDTASIDHIRMHLNHIRESFKAGDFEIPGFVHDQTPAGVPTMTRLKKEIHYKYEQIDQGGQLVISSKNSEAIAAVQDFLRFQITEHKTGDPLLF